MGFNFSGGRLVATSRNVIKNASALWVLLSSKVVVFLRDLKSGALAAASAW